MQRFLLLLFLLVGPLQGVEYSDAIQEVQDHFAQAMRQELDLYCQSTGSQGPEQLEDLVLSFNIYCRATPEEARSLIVYMTDKLAEEVNSHPGIRPYLTEYPFPNERLSLTLAFVNTHLRIRISEETPSKVLKCGKDLIYFKSNAYLDEDEEYLRETYQEAKELVKHSELEFPFAHETTPYERALDEIFVAFTREMYTQYGFKVWGIGAHQDEDQLKEIGARFTIFYKANQKRARKLSVKAAERLVALVNANEAIQPYLKGPFTVDHVKLRLNFRKKNYFSFEKGSLESVSLEQSKLTYMNNSKWVDVSEEEAYYDEGFVGSESFEQAKNLLLR